MKLVAETRVTPKPRKRKGKTIMPRAYTELKYELWRKVFKIERVYDK